MVYIQAMNVGVSEVSEVGAGRASRLNEVNR
jgi:hypothetical protein